jgi:Bacterial type II/III secretion system short domain
VRLKPRSLALAAALLAMSTVAAAGGQADKPTEGVATITYSLRYQAVSEAVSLVFPFLSRDGAVEVRPGENALVIRDRPASLERILPMLRDFDRPGRMLRLGIRVVSAESEPASGEAPTGEPESGLSAELLRRLRELLPFRVYRRVAAADLDIAEGGGVGHELSASYRVDFRMGRLQPDRRIKLYGFRISRPDREADGSSLIHTNVNLRLDKPMVLGLARTEASETALMVVLQCALGEAAVVSPAEGDG